MAIKINKDIEISDSTISLDDLIPKTSTTTSDTNTYSCSYVNNNFHNTTITQLYSGTLHCNTLGTSVNATLSDNTSNYDIIVYRVSNNNSSECAWGFFKSKAYNVEVGNYSQIYVLGGYKASCWVVSYGANEIYLNTREVSGWLVSNIQLNEVYGIKL